MGDSGVAESRRDDARELVDVAGEEVADEDGSGGGGLAARAASELAEAEAEMLLERSFALSQLVFFSFCSRKGWAFSLPPTCELDVKEVVAEGKARPPLMDLFRLLDAAPGDAKLGSGLLRPLLPLLRSGARDASRLSARWPVRRISHVRPCWIPDASTVVKSLSSTEVTAVAAGESAAVDSSKKASVVSVSTA